MKWGLLLVLGQVGFEDIDLPNVQRGNRILQNGQDISIGVAVQEPYVAGIKVYHNASWTRI